MKPSTGKGAVNRRRQTWLITGAAIGLYLLVRFLPAPGDHLNYTDFQADGAAIHDFCEPGSASFVPVEAVRSPVSLALVADSPVEIGKEITVRARLEAASGKPLTAENLLVVHTRKLHLLATDPSLEDYQHLHPRETDVPGEYAFEFTPRMAGRTRFYADFMPRATGRGLYAGSSIEVPGLPGSPEPEPSMVAEAGGVVFHLSTSIEPVRINETVTLELEIARPGGGDPGLELIMDAYAHMVAFDFAGQGFAHLHPLEQEPLMGANGAARLTFLLNLPDPGWYRVWAQVQIAGEELFAPFTLEVVP